MTDAPQRSLVSSILMYVAGFVVLVAAGLWVYSSNKGQSNALLRESDARAADAKQGPSVNFVTVAMSPEFRGLNYLGEARPYQSVTLYAKTSGYVSRIEVDRGDRVRAGQVLAVIDAPENEARIRSAEAQVANLRAVYRRAEELGRLKFFSPQAIEQAKTDSRVAEETLAQARQDRAYQTLKAPFDGAVTARYVDRGALVQNATNAQTSAQPVVTVAQTTRLRVTIYLDQRDANRVHPGDVAEISDPTQPGKTFVAKVARTTGELDDKTRTLMTEVDVDNPDNALLPGSFLQVTVKVKAPSFPEIPAGALVLRGAKTFVATIGPDDVVHFVPVVVAEHDGEKVRLKEGVAVGTRVGVGVGEMVTEGVKVKPVALPPPPGK